jgi:hypothetical protein
MKNMMIHAMLAGILLGSSVSLLADASTKKLNDYNASLDEAVCGKKAHKLAPKLAELLGVDRNKLEQLLVKDKVTYGNVVMAHLVAQKTKEPLEAILKRHQPNSDWSQLLQDAGWTMPGALDRLQEIETETFTLVLDLAT